MAKHNTFRVAVVIHLYYTEMWPYFVDQLEKLNAIDFDLFITLPEVNQAFKETILSEHVGAKIQILPNKGRDVLPFILFLDKTKDKNYDFVLKLHSKKSTHRDDGKLWLDDIVNALIPRHIDLLNELLNTLDSSDTAMVGPKGQYMPLAVNLSANGVQLKKILKKTAGLLRARKALRNSYNFGFFAGTMFWARYDALIPISNANFKSTDFQDEAGQIDGTFAHALERAFCVNAELSGKKIYEISSDDGIKQIEYNSGVIPEWSDLYKKT